MAVWVALGVVTNVLTRLVTGVVYLNDAVAVPLVVVVAAGFGSYR